MLKSNVSRFASWSLVLVLSACASYQTKVEGARKDLSSGRPADAEKVLKPLADDANDDQLVYLLDYAVAEQQAGHFKESAKTFGQAEKMADIQDYTSLSREASSLLLSQGMVQYKGDDYEKVLINGVNAINYLMLGQLDDALVEVRRLNEKLYKYKYEAKRNYEQNPYAFYLSAIIWEADGKYDDSYIDYKHAYDLEPGYQPLHSDLIGAAIRAHRDEDVAKWKAQFPGAQNNDWKTPGDGELIVIYQQGWGPRKYPRPGAPRFPKLFPVSTSSRRAQVEIADVGTIESYPIYSVQDVAIKTLDDDYAALVAKRVAGVAAKAVVADQVRQKNKLLGDLTFLALNAADKADLRQWSTLPETFQIARKYLKAGKYKLHIRGLTAGGSQTGETAPEQEIQITPGKKTFVTWRSFR